MQVLLDRGLVKIAGRAEVPGRPLLYTTTAYFLEHFGLKTTDELPNASELQRVPLPVAKVEEPSADSSAKKTKKAPSGDAETTPAREEKPTAESDVTTVNVDDSPPEEVSATAPAAEVSPAQSEPSEP